jgi:hypothetical protein
MSDLAAAFESMRKLDRVAVAYGGDARVHKDSRFCEEPPIEARDETRATG